MALQTSGAITLSNIQGEFGGSNPIGINEYYRGGSNVPNTSANNSIPTSGTISLSNFYGGVATLPTDNNFGFTVQQYSQGSGKNVFTVYGANSSMSDSSVVTNNGTSLGITNVEISTFGITGILIGFTGGTNAGSNAYNTGGIRGVTLANGTNYPLLAPTGNGSSLNLRATTPGGTMFGEAQQQLSYMSGQVGNSLTFTFTY